MRRVLSAEHPACPHTKDRDANLTLPIDRLRRLMQVGVLAGSSFSFAFGCVCMPSHILQYMLLAEQEALVLMNDPPRDCEDIGKLQM